MVTCRGLDPGLFSAAAVPVSERGSAKSRLEPLTAPAEGSVSWSEVLPVSEPRGLSGLAALAAPREGDLSRTSLPRLERGDPELPPLTPPPALCWPDLEPDLEPDLGRELELGLERPETGLR